MSNQRNTVLLLEKACCLVSQLEGSSLSLPCHNNLPSPLTIFQIGGILYESKKSTTNLDKNNEHLQNLADTFYQLLFNVDREYLSQVIFHEINTAFAATVGSLCNNESSWVGGNVNYETMTSSIYAMCGIYDALVTTIQRHDCLMQYAFNTSVCTTLVTCYDHLIEFDSSDYYQSIDELKTCILRCLSSLLLHGLIYPMFHKIKSQKCSEDESIQIIMEEVQSLTDQSHHMTSFCLGDLLCWQENQKQQEQQNSTMSFQHENMITVISSLFTNDVVTQKEYLLSVLQSAPKSSQRDEIKATKGLKVETKSITQNNTKCSETKLIQKPQSAIDRLIDQIHTIFPHLGEGFIEAALVCYNHDIDLTTTALMECESNPSSLHPRLRVLDKSLPARRKETKNKYEFGRSNEDDDIDKDDREAMEIQKRRIKAMVAAQEDEAYKLGLAMRMNDAEYDDDYDDQYDGVGDGMGGADAGLYDIDFESIKTYNRLTKEIVAEKEFWDQNQNLNRSSKNRSSNKSNKGNNNDNNDDDVDPDCSDNIDDSEQQQNGKKYRGPDKGKGGRIIGPDGRYLPHPKSRKNGKNGNNNQSNVPDTTSDNNKDSKGNMDLKKKSDQMSKIQKRRKNDNKAKIGNHHRKERSLKKTGM